MEMKKENGITLVALIITIIVMLILVAVTVAIIVDSDLIGTAEKTAEMWNEADDNLDNVTKDDIISENSGATGDNIYHYLNAAETSTTD